jgi:alkaline phosphatase D
MKRRTFLSLSLSSLFLGLGHSISMPSLARGKKPVRRITFGSCAEQDKPQPIWSAIAASEPDMFVFIGDNIYADTEDMAVMAQKYRTLGAKQEFATFRSAIPVLATWDDHDYGINDGGVEYPKKQESKQLMLDFFQEPQNSERRRRPGVYTSYYWGPPGQKLQLILLDLRWFRSPLNYDKVKDVYLPSTDPTASMLGPEQWQWLEAELQKPADLRIIASSIQFCAADHRWEKWDNFPVDKKRMLDCIAKLENKNVVFISGDIHYGELSKQTTPSGLSVFDLTSSGMNFVEPGANLPNRNRVALHDKTPNFGLVEIDWDTSPIAVSLQVRTDQGDTVIRKDLLFGRKKLASRV